MIVYRVWSTALNGPLGETFTTFGEADAWRLERGLAEPACHVLAVIQPDLEHVHNPKGAA